MYPSKVCVAEGDGIGPEVMTAVLRVLETLKVPITFQRVDMGRKVYERGLSSGMTDEARAAVEDTGILLKGPMETPKGRGVKSINVTARKMWSAYANKRVFRSMPGVETVFSRAGVDINITMIRENIEDTYGGIEHMLTHDVALCRRLITRPGSEQVHRYAFQLARNNGAKQLTCGHKANIMKLTDGLFLDTFYEVAKDYPEIEANDMIVDDMAMKLVSQPQRFSFVVLPNLQGDILSDLCAGLVGGLGFAPSANIGEHVSIFEAVHGTAPDIAGKGVANPCALLMSAAMMLRHLGLRSYAASLDAAILRTLRNGFRTSDFGSDRHRALGTTEFVTEIERNLDPVLPAVQRPENWAPSVLSSQRMMVTPKRAPERLVGADLFLESDLAPKDLAEQCQARLPKAFLLTMVSNRGTQVWPGGSRMTDCINQYRIRVEKREKGVATVEEVLAFASAIHAVARLCSVEMLQQFGTQPGYSLAQGQ